MSARALAIVGLITALSCLSSAQTPGREDAPLFVYLGTGPNRNSLELTQMRGEAEKLMQAVGYRLEWRTLSPEGTRETAPDLVIVKLEGNCAAPMNPQVLATAPVGGFSLASTSTSDGVVLPFSNIHCDALTRMLGPAFSHLAPGQRAYLYGRAMGRLLAHELYHVLAQTQDHTLAGISKPCFNTTDLLEKQFSFETGILAKVRPERSPEPVDSFPMDTETGR